MKKFLKGGALIACATALVTIVMSGFAFGGQNTGTYTVHYFDAANGTEIVEPMVVNDVEIGVPQTVSAPAIPGYTLIGSSTADIVIEGTRTVDLTNRWIRTTPCNYLQWDLGDYEMPILVVKKGHDYIIWTVDKLTPEQQTAVYESYKSNVNGMNGAKFENCLFEDGPEFYADGVYANGDYVSFDEHCTWSIFATGVYEVSYVSSPVDVNFFYTEMALL